MYFLNQYKATHNKLILDNLSGTFEPGTATAILGPSGSGKTSLLNVLASRMRESPNIELKGDILINQKKVVSIRKLKHRISYVLQDDILWEDLTVYEQLVFTAKLAGVSGVKKKVNQLIQWLNLEKCKDTRVGSALKRNLSGGERKRCSIAMEVITEPSLIFLDEPTTGLDSKSALDVAKILKMLARCGRTLITTIHQPSSEILNSFDNIIFLCEGKIVYDGPPSRIPVYFKEIGYPPPPLTNPADHLMALFHDDDLKLKAYDQGKNVPDEVIRKQFLRRLNHFVGTYHLHKKPIPKTACCSKEWKHLEDNPQKMGLCSHFWTLTHRSYIIFFRKPQLFLSRMAQIAIYSIIIIAAFKNLTNPEDDTVEAIRGRTGMSTSTMNAIGVSGLFASLYGIIPIISPFMRDHEKRLYKPTLFYIVATFYEIPIQILIILIYQLSYYYILDFKKSREIFLKYFLSNILVFFASSGFGDILSISMRDIKIIVQAVPFIYLPLYLLSGGFGFVKDMNIVVRGISYLSFLKFGYQANTFLEFDENIREEYLKSCKIRPRDCFDYSCTIKKDRLSVCDSQELLNFDINGFYINSFFLFLQIILYRLIAWGFWLKYTNEPFLPYRDRIPKKSSFIEKKAARNQKLKVRPRSLANLVNSRLAKGGIHTKKKMEEEKIIIKRVQSKFF